jgi:hypothetical protein
MRQLIRSHTLERATTELQHMLYGVVQNSGELCGSSPTSRLHLVQLRAQINTTTHLLDGEHPVRHLAARQLHHVGDAANARQVGLREQRDGLAPATGAARAS